MHRADGLQAGEQEAAEDGAIDAAEPADDGGGKADDAEIEPDAEIDLVVIEAVHHPGEGGKPRADREGDEHDGGEIDAHGARRFFVLRDGANSQTQLGAVEQVLQPDDHRTPAASMSTLSSRRLNSPRSIELRGNSAGKGFGLAPCG